MRISEPMAEGSPTCDQARFAKLVHSAHEFEAQLMKELLQPLCKSDDQDEEQAGHGGALTAFAAEALATGLSGAGGLGVSQRIVREVSRIEIGCADESKTARGPVPADLSLK